MGTKPGSEPLERRLLAAATGLTGARRIPELVARLRPAFLHVPSPWVAGLGIHDEERGLFLYHALVPGQPEPEILEVPATQAEVRCFEAGERGCQVQALSTETASAFARAL